MLNKIKIMSRNISVGELTKDKQVNLTAMLTSIEETPWHAKKI